MAGQLLRICSCRRCLLHSHNFSTHGRHQACLEGPTEPPGQYAESWTSLPRPTERRAQECHRRCVNGHIRSISTSWKRPRTSDAGTFSTTCRGRNSTLVRRLTKSATALRSSAQKNSTCLTTVPKDSI